jgi:hypothetical protein
MKVFRSDNGCFFNEALIWVERNDGNEVLDSFWGEAQQIHGIGGWRKDSIFPD